MDWLNYHHLLYFWAVARNGSVTKAARELQVSQPTVSGQLRTLEEALGERLFEKSGRSLALTEVGHVAFKYADEIFSLGQEFMDTIKGRPTGKPLKLRVGITDVTPKLISYRLLAPALEMEEPVRVICSEGKTEQLLAELAMHELDLVLADAPLPPNTRFRAFNHLLGECGVSFFVARRLRVGRKRPFPECLDGAPLLLPTNSTLLRSSLDQWLSKLQIAPNVVAEIEDSALLKVFGEFGEGVFPAPTIVEDEICKTYGVRVLGRVEQIRERFYAITADRRIKHPAALAITDFARNQLFG